METNAQRKPWKQNATPATTGTAASVVSPPTVKLVAVPPASESLLQKEQTVCAMATD